MFEEGGEYVNGIGIEACALVFGSMANGVTDVTGEAVGLVWRKMGRRWVA